MITAITELLLRYMTGCGSSVLFTADLLFFIVHF